MKCRTRVCLGTLFVGCVGVLGCRTSSPNAAASSVPVRQEIKRDELQRLMERLSKGGLVDEEVDTYFLVAQQLFLEKKINLAQKIYAAIFEVRPTLVVGLRLGEVYLLGSHFEEAERVALRLDALFPGSSEPAVALSRVQFLQGRGDEALRTLKRSLADHPGDDAVAAPYIELLLRQGKNIDARTALEKLVKDPSVSPYFLQKLAEMEIKEKHLPAAKAYLDRLLRMAPENVEGWTLAGFIAMEEKDTKAAERYFREAHLKQPDNDSLSRYYVLQLLRQDKFREARRILVKLEAGGEPGKGLDAELTFQLAFVFYQLDEFEEARKRFLALVDKADDPGRPLFYAAQCEEAMKRWPEARTTYERIPENSAFARKANVRRVYLRLEVGAVKEAHALLETMNVSSEGDEEDFRLLALVHGRVFEYEKAFEIAATGLKKFPDSVELAFHSATWREFTQTRADAILAMQELLKQHPDFAQAMNYLAYTYAEQRVRLEEAQRLAEKAVHLQPKDAFFLDTLGWVYFRQGKLVEAEIHLVRALANEPDEPVILEHLGEVSLARGDLSAALKHFELAERKFHSQPAWKVEGDREWREARKRVLARVVELRKKALP